MITEMIINNRYDEAIRHANLLLKEAEEYRSAIKSLEMHIDNLNDKWLGNSAFKYETRVQQWISDANRTANAIEDISKDIIVAANQIKQNALCELEAGLDE